MKTIKWDQCDQSVIGKYSPKDDKLMTTLNIPIMPDMHVSAKYKGLDIHLRILRIIKEIEPKIFSATVMHFRPIPTNKPDDLFIDDEVFISRSDMCCIYLK